MKVSKTTQISYSLDKDLEDYTLREISDYCNSHGSCGNCIFKFLCKLPSGAERDLVEPAFWRSNADKFQESKEFQLILEDNYKKEK